MKTSSQHRKCRNLQSLCGTLSVKTADGLVKTIFYHFKGFIRIISLSYTYAVPFELIQFICRTLSLTFVFFQTSYVFKFPCRRIHRKYLRPKSMIRRGKHSRLTRKKRGIIHHLERKTVVISFVQIHN